MAKTIEALQEEIRVRQQEIQANQEEITVTQKEKKYHFRNQRNRNIHYQTPFENKK